MNKFKLGQVVEVIPEYYEKLPGLVHQLGEITNSFTIIKVDPEYDEYRLRTNNEGYKQAFWFGSYCIKPPKLTIKLYTQLL